MKKIMICVAPVAAGDPLINPRAIARDVYDCYKNGAAMVHLHVRDLNGRLTPSLTLLEETAQYIRELCDIIIEISTGGVSDLTIEERVQPCYAPWVEATSLNVGSVNLGEAVYANPIRDVRYCVKQIVDHNKIPETELFELGMANTLRELDEMYHLPKPLMLALVFGHPGEMPATPAALKHMIGGVYDNFPKDAVKWGYTEAHRTDFEMVKQALLEGADALRIGFEDSDYINRYQRVRTNSELIKEAVKLVRDMGMEPMSSDEMRSVINIPPLNKETCFNTLGLSTADGFLQEEIFDVRKAEKQKVIEEVASRNGMASGITSFKNEGYAILPQVPGRGKMGVHSLNCLEDKIFLNEFIRSPYVRDIIMCQGKGCEGREFIRSLAEDGRNVKLLAPDEKLLEFTGRTYVEHVKTDKAEYNCDLFVAAV